MKKNSVYLKTYILIIFVIGVYVTRDIFADVTDRPIVVISIDAETKRHDNFSITLPEQLDLKIDGRNCGIRKIMEVCDRYDVKATFFLNVYEYKKYGEQAVKRIAQYINDKGFDVQLHTHPHWAYDKKRNRMYQYSLNEQIRIIKDGKNLIEKWIGKKPVIHRAGAYSANENTLKALNANDIFYDSSFFFSYPTCLLQDLNLKKNFVSISNGVYQIPVNVFYLERYAEWFDFMQPLKGIVKYDIDSVDYNTLINAIDKGIEHKFNVIVLFLHSFSFIEKYNEENKVPDLVDIKEFDNVLEYIKKKRLKVMTFSSYINEINLKEAALNNSDAIPVVSTKINTFKFMAKKVGVKGGELSKVITYSSVIFIIFIFLVLVTFLVRKKKNVGNITCSS